MTKKQELDFTAKIPHHDLTEADVKIQRYESQESPVITIATYDSIDLTLDELRQIVRLGELFERAENIMKGLEQ